MLITGMIPPEITKLDVTFDNSLVNTAYDNTIEFSKYKTLQWLSDADKINIFSINPTLAKELQQKMNPQFNSRGLQIVSGNSDLQLKVTVDKKGHRIYNCHGLHYPFTGRIPPPPPGAAGDPAMM